MFLCGWQYSLKAFDNLVEFHFVIRFSPRKYLVNLACSFPVCVSIIPILTESDFSDDSVPVRNLFNCSSNSCQLRVTFPVKETGSGGLQRLSAIADNVLYKFLYIYQVENKPVHLDRDVHFSNTSDTMW